MIIVKSDKTGNLYYVSTKLYKKLMINNLTSNHSIASIDPTININNEAALLLNDRKVKNKKIPKYQKSEAFLTIKDHKPNFPYKISCRTINPSKSHIGKWTKVILQNHIEEIRSKSELLQWKNSNDVIDWFQNINDKKHKCFINFDIKNFYPSINKVHLLKAIEFSKKYTDFTDDEIELIMHTCQTVVYYDNRMWTKSSNNEHFDIAMGSYHGAEVCDLVGLFIAFSCAMYI